MPYLSSLLLCLACFSQVFADDQDDKQQLRMRYLVPKQTSRNTVYNTEETIPAVQMAVDDLNNRSDYLPDYQIVVDISDTRCDPSEGTWQMIKSVLDTSSPNVTNIIAFMDGGCSIVTEPIAALSGRLYKVVQVSNAAASPILTDRNMYPLFYRTHPSENLFNNLHFVLMNLYDWCIVATLHQTVNLFSLSVTDFHERFNETLGHKCTSEDEKPILFSFTSDPEIPLRQIKSKDVRIIFGYFYEDKAVIVFCYAKHMGLIGGNYQWILPGWFTDGWWKMADTMDWSNFRFNCTSDEIVEAVQYALLVDFYSYPPDESVRSISGYTTEEYKEKYGQYFANYLVSDQYEGNSTSIDDFDTVLSTLAYDAVWSLALALNRTENKIKEYGLTLADFEYSTAPPDEMVVGGTYNETYDDYVNKNISDTLSQYMSELNFEGVSGNVRFESGDRNGYLLLLQHDINGNTLNTTRIGIHNFEIEGLEVNFDTEPKWRDGKPPADRSMPRNVTISYSLVIAMNFFIAIGIVIAISLLVFNTVTIRKPLIWNSAPLINTVIISGCILLMCTCILLGIDSSTGSNGDIDHETVSQSTVRRYEIICNVRLWFLTIGFTLSFGALFAKTWQVYRVYTNIKLRDKPFNSLYFFAMMGVLLCVDVVFLSIWTGLYQFERGIDRDVNQDTTEIYEYCKCENFSYLVGTLYVYKGLMAIFGLFLAYESRNLKYDYINDSRFVSIAMYIVVILVGISAPLSLVLSEERFVDPAYGVAVFMITLACVSCLLILYIPKFYYMAKGKDTMFPKQKREALTPGKLQLGSMTNTDTEKTHDVKSKAEKIELREEKRRGSDQDSGVHCTITDDINDGLGNHNSSTTSSGLPMNGTSLNNTTDTVLTENGAEDDSSEYKTGATEISKC